MIPTVPAFSTLRSMFSAWAICGELPGFLDDVSRCIGSPSDGEHELGKAVAKLSAGVFRGEYSAEELIERHTQVPLFASIMSPLQGLTWTKQVAARCSGRDVIAEHIRRTHQIQATTLRRCPACVREDQQRYGCGHWRIFHQWPVARHCVVHGVRLQTLCRNCQAPIARGQTPQLADDRCRVCGGDEWTSEGFDAPPAYWSMLWLMWGALQGNQVQLTPFERARRRWRRGAITLDSNEFAADVADSLLRPWRSESMDDVATMIGVHRWQSAHSPSDAQLHRPVGLMALAVEGAVAANRRQPVWMSGSLGGERIPSGEIRQRVASPTLAYLASAV